MRVARARVTPKATKWLLSSHGAAACLESRGRWFACRKIKSIEVETLAFSLRRTLSWKVLEEVEEQKASSQEVLPGELLLCARPSVTEVFS